jgi:hypothetical protein
LHPINKDELLNKQIVAVINLPPKLIGPYISEYLVTGFYRDSGEAILAVPDKKFPIVLNLLRSISEIFSKPMLMLI